MTQVWRLVGIGSVNDQSYYTRTGLVLFRERLSFPPVNTVSARSLPSTQCRALAVSARMTGLGGTSACVQ